MPTHVKNNNKIDAEDIRHFIMDREAADNPLLMDLAFSDEEIQHAMRFACLSFNDIQPYVITIHPEAVPFEMLFIHGVLYHLYLSKMSQVMRRDVDHTAGNMTVDVTKRQIANLQSLSNFHKTEFETAAKNKKLAINIGMGFARVG